MARNRLRKTSICPVIKMRFPLTSKGPTASLTFQVATNRLNLGLPPSRSSNSDRDINYLVARARRAHYFPLLENRDMGAHDRCHLHGAKNSAMLQ